MPLRRIGRLVMDLSHSTSCTHKFSKKTHPIVPSSATCLIPLPRGWSQIFLSIIKKKIAGNCKTARHGMIASTVIQGRCSHVLDACNSRTLRRPPSLHQHVIISAIRTAVQRTAFQYPSSYSPYARCWCVHASHNCGYRTTCYGIQDSRKFMARLPAALCYLDVPSMTMMDPASPVRIVPAWSRLPNEPIKIARR